MAAKSDFAQKLLNDLRLRKERMGVSQSSTRNHATARDAYKDPGIVKRGGSRHTKSIGGYQQLTSSRGSNQALNIKESSQQIVPYSGGNRRRSESTGDLSTAFTYAVKNGGKLMNVDFTSAGNTNKMIDFLNQIGRRSLDAGNARNGTITSLVKHGTSNGVVAPALTTIQIKEISKGIQNLYEIIRSTSNGTNVNRYSMEVGKELLKGAKGLEESLRMLVNLQEASEMMVPPQRKSRITLLEVDEENKEDERSKIVERNQVALPRFSFDKPSKKSNSQLTDVFSKYPTHQWSAVADAESVGRVSYAKPSSEKGRISNVIAKLMGLEEVPVKVDSYTRWNETTKANESSTNIVNTPSKAVKDVVIPVKSNSKRGEMMKGDDVNKKTVTKTSRPVKVTAVSLKDQIPQQIQDSKNGESRINQSIKNNRSDRIPDQKIHSKRRNPAAASVLQVEKKKTVRNNQIQEPERRVQKSKQNSQQIKPVENTISVSKELKPQPFEGNQKVKDSTQKAQKHERTQQMMVPVTRKKLDLMAAGRTESPRTKDEVLRRRNRTLDTLSTPSKHKLSVLKETNRNEVLIRSEPEVIKSKRTNSISNANETESTARSYAIVPFCENESKRDPKITSEVVVAGISTSEIAGSPNKSNLSDIKPKKAFYSSIRVVLTEQEKQLKEILIKDQLFLSTTEALFKLNIPVGFLHADDHSHHENETKLKLDCGYEILKRKARSQELSVHPFAKPSIGDTSIRSLDELVKRLYKDLEGLQLYGRDTRNVYNEADYLHHMLEKDIHNKNQDINSFWDFGWHITTFTFVEKDEFVSDVEQDMLCRLVDEIVDDLLIM